MARGLTRPRLTSGHVALLAVAAGYTALVLVRTSASMSFGYDEAVYASQVVADVPAAPFSAHRARGMSVLLAPVALVTGSEIVIRTYLSLLAGLALYLAFRPWLAAYPAGVPEGWRFVPAVAAGLFASLWATVLHGSMALPNLWLAFALAVGVGYLARGLQTFERAGGVWWVFGAFALAALLRPSDAVVAAAPALVAMVVVGRWRRVRLLVAVCGGLSAGVAVWAAEAYALFGDPLTRLRSSAQTVGGGLTWNLSAHLEAVAGPCPPDCDGVAWTAALWWVSLPALVLLGLLAAYRARAPIVVLPAACGLSVAVPYLLMVDVPAASRLLLPTYALLAIPIAAGIVWLVEREHRWSTTAAAAAVVVLLSGHLVVQQQVLDRARGELTASADRVVAQAEHLGTVHDVRAPCLIVGEAAMQLGYLLRCRPVRATPDRLPAVAEEIADARRRGVAVVVWTRRDAELPAVMADWRMVELPAGGDEVAYLPS